MTGRGRALTAMCACALVVWLLHEANEQLPAPAVGSWADAVRWHEEVGAPMAAMAVLRLATMVMATWLGLMIGLQALAARRPGGGLEGAVRAVSPSWLRGLAHGMAGISMSAGLAVPTTAVAHPLPVQEQPADEGTAVMRPIPDTSTTTSTSSTLAPVTPVAPVAPTPGRGATSEFIVVAPGDSCWSIAAAALSDRIGHEVEDRIVVDYWRRVLDANSDRFVVRGNPHLIFPGQELVLPPP